MYDINVVKYSRYKKGIMDLMDLAETDIALDNWSQVCKQILRDHATQDRLTADEYTRLRAFITKYYIKRLVTI